MFTYLPGVLITKTSLEYQKKTFKTQLFVYKINRADWFETLFSANSGRENQLIVSFP